ncbi:MAG: LuxR C-terminal-related transcriptional regulator [Gaiellaceae bacterium]
MPDAITTPEDLIVRANEALARADWDGARALFLQALEKGETPEALEGLGRASWWLDDADAVRDARERAYRLYRERGDVRGAARVALELAEDALVFRAEEAVSNGWTERARRLLDGVEPSPEHGLLAVRDAFFALLLGGDTDAARTRAADAIELARRFHEVDLEMLARSIEGAALVAAGEVAEGMRRLDEATAAATGGEMRDLELIGQTCCWMIYGCERVRDFDRAAQWCDRVQEFCRRFGLGYLLAVCRTQYATVLTARGDWNGAEVELLAAAEQLAQRPGQAVDAVVRLGELRRRQGRLEEAAALFDEVEFLAEAQAGRAALALDTGDAAGAADSAERFLRQLAETDRTQRAYGLELLARARAARGELDAAHAALAELDELARKIGTDFFRAGAAFAGGAVAAAAGDTDRARRLLQDAVDLYGRHGLPYEAASARLALAEVLASERRRPEAAAEAGRAAQSLEAIGAGPRAESARERAASYETAAAGGPDALTRRESEILRLVAEGLSNKQIAARLTLSEHTVHRHVANILVKLRLSSRAAAAAYAAKHGLTE